MVGSVCLASALAMESVQATVLAKLDLLEELLVRRLVNLVTSSCHVVRVNAVAVLGLVHGDTMAFPGAAFCSVSGACLGAAC
mmetsp:Transcript_35061/g.71743  ORF Transcript_35061/g.71743 Transcript_35061/m.71743 type:complete len:82 (+) Transcript_35061:99-344(+)